jgi:hypothetical protein
MRPKNDDASEEPEAIALGISDASRSFGRYGVGDYSGAA